MSDEPLRPPPDPRNGVGDHLEIIFTEGPDGEEIIDTILTDRSGIGDALERARKHRNG